MNHTYCTPAFIKRLANPTAEALYKTIKKMRPSTLVDATGGLGFDAFCFASMGLHVTVIEKSPLLAQAIHFALIEALQHNIPGCKNIQLLCTDSLQKLPNLQADVCYLDPLFEKELKAKPKQKAQWFKEHGSPTSARELFEAALQGKFKRIIIKTPLSVPPIQGPTFQVFCKTHRFDVFEQPTL